MSGIYISGMEVPKEAGTYRIEFDQCGNPYLLSENGDLGLWHIISVPEHGRLIDADALMERFSYSPGDTAEDRIWIWAARRIIIEAPTIIPADPVKEEQT